MYRMLLLDAFLRGRGVAIEAFREMERDLPMLVRVSHGIKPPGEKAGRVAIT